MTRLHVDLNIPATASDALREELQHKERGVDYAPGDASDTADDEATLRWMDRQPNARRSP